MKSIYPPIIILLSLPLFGCAYPRSYYEIPTAVAYPVVVPSPAVPQVAQPSEIPAIDQYTEAVYEAHANEAYLQIAGQRQNESF